MKGISQFHNFILRPIGDHLKEIKKTFMFISFTHVYWELNMIVESLSKEGQLLIEGYMNDEEVREEASYTSLINL
jgi:hypothetical protein